MKLVRKLSLCLYNFSVLRKLFSRVLLGNCFWCSSSYLKYLKLFWYQTFVHYKLKLLDVLSEFLLMSCLNNTEGNS